jgi:3'-5' exoribonuclease
VSVVSIRELKARTTATPSDAVVHVQVDTAQVKMAKSGNEFLELRLTDATDAFVLRIWSDAPAMASARRLIARSMVEVQASWTQNSFGLDAKNVALRDLTPEEGAGLLAGPVALREKQARDWEHILAFCAEMKDPRLHALCHKFLTDFGERFRRTGAARDYHHARRGGLVEHVAQMMRSAVALAGAYPSLNRDLLVAGVLFHDSGKLWENVYEAQGFAMPYLERGEMLGHISVGIELVNALWRGLSEGPRAAEWLTLTPASEDVRLHLLHLIGSHHGELEFGSPIHPKTPEAIVLHHVDNIDAKLEMMFDSYATSARLAPRIYERRRPLPSRLIEPLARFEVTEERPPEAAPSVSAPPSAAEPSVSASQVPAVALELGTSPASLYFPS